MNTETPKKSKFDILEEIMISFQDDYETDYAQTHWVKTYKERKERLIQLQEEEYELQANVIDDARILLPCSALLGAIFVISCDLLGKIIAAPYELPAGIIMSFVGGPFFLYLLLKKKGGRRVNA